MKVYIIDPWGVNNTSHYLNGLTAGISRIKGTSAVLFTNFYFKKNTDAEYEIIPTFFKISEKMKAGKFRKIIRGAEYFCGQLKILKYIKKNKPDIVHINWLLLYKLDKHFIDQLKKSNIPVVYTAHDVLPHVNPEKYISDLEQIYLRVDKIIVHGENLKKEFSGIFHDLDYKIYVQHHGCNETSVNCEYGNISENIDAKIKSYKHIFIFFGHLFYAKGADRIIKYWLHTKPDNVLLIVCGEKNPCYNELTVLEDEISKCDGILYINHFVEEGMLNYFISCSDLILLPYRHASMSGVIFTAAEFSKTVLSTRTGAIDEYVMDEFCFLTDNSDSEYFKMTDNIIKNVDELDFDDMGKKLHDYILLHNNWNTIAEGIIKNVYIPLCEKTN